MAEVGAVAVAVAELAAVSVVGLLVNGLLVRDDSGKTHGVTFVALAPNTSSGSSIEAMPTLTLMYTNPILLVWGKGG